MLFTTFLKAQSSVLVGKWKFYAYIYNGQVFSAPNPNLNEYLTIDTTKINLFYEKLEEGLSCERNSNYVYSAGNQDLIQTVYWVNPKNSPNCASDPDMQLGITLKNKAYIKNDDLYLETPFGEESLIFLWKKEAKE